MKITLQTFFIFTFFTLISGCATPPPDIDEKEFSDMPWNTPKQWEGSRQVPGIGGLPGRGI